MLSTGPRLLPNIGAEEGDWRALQDEPFVRVLASLWADLLRDPDPIFGWLPQENEFCAWLNTDEAARAATAADASLYGADPQVVHQVHDKAFAHGVNLEQGLEPSPLRGLAAVLDEEALGDPTTALRCIAETLASWPESLRRQFALKPRFGADGRGHVRGRDGRADTPEIRSALPQLRQRGGAVLEPWLQGEQDLSVQLCIVRDASIVLVSSPEQVMSARGACRGHRGLIDARGRVTSGSRHDEGMREAAAMAAHAAAARGYRGPCGVDGLVFRCGDGVQRLRPLVEFNARFTTGLIAAAAIRRHLGEIKTRTGLRPGEQRAFYFGLEAPGAGWPDLPDEGSAFLPLGSDALPGRPGLFLARDAAHLDGLLTGPGRT